MRWRRRYLYWIPYGLTAPIIVWSLYSALHDLAAGTVTWLSWFNLIVAVGCSTLNLTMYRYAKANGYWEHVDFRVCECGHPVSGHGDNLAPCVLAWAPDSILAEMGEPRCDCQGCVVRPVWWRRVVRKVSSA